MDSFTLLELLVVILIIGLLTGIVAPRLVGQVSKSEVTAARAQLDALDKALQAYRLDTGHFPSASQGLNALVSAPSGDQFRLANLYQSLALMFRGGYTFDEALRVGEGLGLGPRMRGGLARAGADIARGRSASRAMADAGLTEVVTQRLLAVGERSGAFDAVLQTISERHAQAFGTFIERASRIVEPVLLLLVALVVGGLVVLMYMPIFDMANGIGASP